MEVRRGYKQTEVGVIPDEWDVKLLGDLFGFSGGYLASRDQLSTEGHCYLHYGDIHGSARAFVDACVDYQDIPKLDIPLKRVSSRSLLKNGDVVFVDASEDDEGTSKHVVVVNEENVPFISGLHTIVAKSKTDELVHEYRRYCFQTAAIRQQFLFYAVGTKVVGISKSNIPKLFLPVPTPPEQCAIAAALSDVDALLGGLDRLIAKNRDLKQAAMQQLLTGQIRLPGFKGEWRSRKVRELGTVVTGGTPSTHKAECWNGPFPWVTPTDIRGQKDIHTTDRQLTSHGLGALRPLPANSVLVTCIASIGKNAILRRAGACNQQINAVVPTPENDADFLFYLFEINTQYLLANAGITATLIISKRDFSELHFQVPDRKEQVDISAVLSDMDAELSALEARRNKTRALKQAMMQELLTGKTRLVPAGAAHA